MASEPKVFEQVYSSPLLSTDYTYGYSESLALSPDNNPYFSLTDPVLDCLSKPFRLVPTALPRSVARSPRA